MNNTLAVLSQYHENHYNRKELSIDELSLCSAIQKIQLSHGKK